jgi:hypothetical protein
MFLIPENYREKTSFANVRIYRMINFTAEIQPLQMSRFRSFELSSLERRRTPACERAAPAGKEARSPRSVVAV